MSFIVTAMTIWDKSNEQKTAPKSRSYIFASKSNNNNEKEKEIKRTLPRPGIIQSSCELSGFEPGTFRSSV